MMSWFYVNNNVVIEFEERVVKFLNVCQAYNNTCSLIDIHRSEREYGTVFCIDFQKMIIFNERYLYKYDLIKDNYTIIDGKKYLTDGRLVKEINIDVFKPYCNHTPFYFTALRDIQYPELTNTVILESCNHDSGCHVRTCRTHNGELDGWYNMEHNYSLVPYLLRKSDSRNVYKDN